MWVYDEKKQTEQKEIQTVQSEEKKSNRKFNAGAKACVLRDENFKDRPDVKWNKE